MDASQITVRHALSVNTLNIRHSFELSPSLAKELRYCVVIIVTGWISINAFRALAQYRQHRPLTQ